MFTRRLGRSGIEVSALGIGCWAIGGPIYRDGKQSGWGEVDDNESIRAIHRALEMGVTFLDTADIYGAVTVSASWRRRWKVSATR